MKLEVPRVTDPRRVPSLLGALLSLICHAGEMDQVIRNVPIQLCDSGFGEDAERFCQHSTQSEPLRPDEMVFRACF